MIWNKVGLLKIINIDREDIVFDFKEVIILAGVRYDNL